MVTVINITYITNKCIYKTSSILFFEVNVSNRKCGLWGFYNLHRPNHLNVLVDVVERGPPVTPPPPPPLRIFHGGYF